MRRLEEMFRVCKAAAVRRFSVPGELCIQEDFPVESAASRSGRIGDR